MSLVSGKGKTYSNVIQIVLVAIVFPFVAILIGAISGPSGSQTLMGIIVSLIGKIPLCDVWVDILYQYSGALSAADVASSTVLVVLKAFPEALISAICGYVCERIFSQLNTRGLPIFATFLGISAAAIIMSLTGLTGNLLAEILMDVGVIIIMIIGIKIMFKSAFGGAKIMSSKKILIFVIDGLFAVITTAYIAGLLLAAAGVYASIGEAVTRLGLLMIVEMAAGFITWVISRAAADDNIL